LREAFFQGVPAGLIRAIITVESGWNPYAVRQEPRIGDASYGLMQILGGTARDLGFSGTSSDLLNPSINVHWGVKYLKSRIERYPSDIDAAIAAYNSGTARKGVDGAFINQEYVDRVKREWGV